MLKITLHDSAEEFRFRLEGKLSGPWVGELRQCWTTASSTTGGRRTVADLREVDFVDEAGEELLCDMARGGVKLQVATPLMQGVAEQVWRRSGCDRVEETPSRKSDALVCADASGSHTRAL
jgi:ABC-type transporter Mla MlaB component